MPYTSLSYAKLQEVTSRLQETFHKESHYYTPPFYDVLCDKCGDNSLGVNNMQATYLRYVEDKKPKVFGLFWKVAPDPERIAEIACITRLVADLKKDKTKPETPERIQTHNIMLGAGICRQQIIHASYAGTALGYYVLPYLPTTMSGWFSRENATASHQTLVDLLDINEENKLDDLSIFTCCTAYQNHLKKIGATLNSAYIRDEPQFFEQLQAIITQARRGAEDIIRRMKPLVAIQSIAGMLSKTDEEICGALPILAAILSKKLTKKDRLSRDDMIACMKSDTALSERVQLFIEYLIDDGMIVSHENCGAFATILTDRLAVNSQNILLGIYGVVINDVHVDSEVVKTLKKSMGAHEVGNDIDEDTFYLPLNALAHYLTLPRMSDDFDFKAWPSHEVLTKKVELQIGVLEEKRATVVATA